MNCPAYSGCATNQIWCGSGTDCVAVASWCQTAGNVAGECGNNADELDLYCGRLITITMKVWAFVIFSCAFWMTHLAWHLVNSRSPKGVVAIPQEFSKQLFFSNILRQTLPANHFYILCAPFDVYGVKLGGVVWVWGWYGGLVKSHDFYFAHFLNIWQDYVLQTCFVDENRHFLTYSAKNPAKIPSSYNFLTKIDFC